MCVVASYQVGYKMLKDNVDRLIFVALSIGILLALIGIFFLGLLIIKAFLTNPILFIKISIFLVIMAIISGIIAYYIIKRLNKL